MIAKGLACFFEIKPRSCRIQQFDQYFSIVRRFVWTLHGKIIDRKISKWVTARPQSRPSLSPQHRHRIESRRAARSEDVWAITASQ
jgi:hypothetical protein